MRIWNVFVYLCVCAHCFDEVMATAKNWHEWNGWIWHLQAWTLHNDHLFWTKIHIPEAFPIFFFFHCSIPGNRYIHSLLLLLFLSVIFHFIFFHWSFDEILHEQSYTRKINLILVKTINVFLGVHCTCKLLNWIFGHNISYWDWNCLKKSLLLAEVAAGWAIS